MGVQWMNSAQSRSSISLADSGPSQSGYVKQMVLELSWKVTGVLARLGPMAVSESEDWSRRSEGIKWLVIIVKV